MADFIKGTTPTFSIQLSGNKDFSELGTVMVRFKQGNVCVDVTPVVTSLASVATVTLTQEQTLGFRSGAVQVQLVGVSNTSNQEVVVKSEIAEINVKDSIITTAQHN